MNTDLDWRYSQAYPKEPVERLAKRLKREWLAFKDSEKVTQTIAAEHLGISQAAFAQFLSGACPISNVQLVAICKYMKISPIKLVAGIEFFEKFFNSVLIHNEDVEVKYILGRVEKLAVEIDQPFQIFDKYEVIVADGRFSGYYEAATRLLVSILPIPKIPDGWDLFIKLNDSSDFIIGKYKQSSNEALIYDIPFHAHLAGTVIDLYHAGIVHTITGTARIAPEGFS